MHLLFCHTPALVWSLQPVSRLLTLIRTSLCSSISIGWTTTGWETYAPIQGGTWRLLCRQAFQARAGRAACCTCISCILCMLWRGNSHSNIACRIQCQLGIHQAAYLTAGKASGQHSRPRRHRAGLRRRQCPEGHVSRCGPVGGAQSRRGPGALSLIWGILFCMFASWPCRYLQPLTGMASGLSITCGHAHAHKPVCMLEL